MNEQIIREIHESNGRGGGDEEVYDGMVNAKKPFIMEEPVRWVQKT